jgi:hypothetical protein
MDIKGIGSHLNASTIAKTYTPSVTDTTAVATQAKPVAADKIEISPEARLKQSTEAASTQNTKYTEKLNSGYYNSKQVASVIAEKMLVELSKM